MDSASPRRVAAMFHRFSLNQIPRRAHNLSAVRSQRPCSFHAKARRSASNQNSFAFKINAGQNLVGRRRRSKCLCHLSILRLAR
jgi:hypothetical protein